jgi:hypothetical protein
MSQSFSESEKLAATTGKRFPPDARILMLPASICRPSRDPSVPEGSLRAIGPQPRTHQPWEGNTKVEARNPERIQLAPAEPTIGIRQASQRETLE